MSTEKPIRSLSILEMLKINIAAIINSYNESSITKAKSALSRKKVN